MPSPRRLLAEAKLRPKKRYAQNFLQNENAVRAIAELAMEGVARDARVLEIGAGTGALTLALLERGANLTAIEIDPELVTLLQARTELSRARIVEADALTFDYGAWADGNSWHAAGNLPYNVATAVLLRLIEMEDAPASLTVMVQKDVAERFAAAAGTPAYGSLSIAVQYAMRVTKEMTLSPGSFYPAPKVESSVVRLVRRAQPAAHPRDPATFWKVVRGAFAYRRKTLANSLALALGIDRARIARALDSIHLSPELRGERLDLGDFARLADALAEE